MPPYAAYLRVYEPVDPAGAARWRRWADRPEGDAATGPAAERARGLAALLASPPLPAPAQERNEAFVLTVDEVTYACPWQTRARCWLALAELRESVPAPVLDAFWPPEVVAAAEGQLARWRALHPGRPVHILTSTWQVPLRWFVAFSPTERVLEVDEERGAGRPPGAPRPRRLYYRTPMASARRRVERSLTVLRRSFDGGPLADGVADLGRWLAGFDEAALVELDYGGLVSLVPADALAADRSAAEVHKALAALASGDAESAAANYRVLVDRWRALADFGHAS